MMNEIFEIAFNVSMNTLVAGSMVAMGLSLTVSQIIEPFKNIRMVILSLIANFLIVPLFAFGLVWLLPVSEGVRIGIILVSLGGGAPFIPMVVKTAKGRIAGAIGLMLLLVLVTIFFMPLLVPMIFSGESVSSLAIARSLIFTMLVPLLLGLFVKAYFSDIAVRSEPIASMITNIAIAIAVIAMVFLYTKIIIANLLAVLVVILFFLGCMAIGYFTGGKSRNARIILSVGTGLRNPPITILVASNNFSTEPMAAIVPLLVIIL